MSDEAVEYHIFPEMRAGGYPRGDHRMEFIVRVNALLTPDMVVLDFGAGRGKWQYDPIPLRRWLGDFRGRCARVIGADVDPAIQENPQVDERVLLLPNQPIPLPDASVDLITAFSVFEHIEDPVFWSRELDRILRPGGWICAWTPNRNGCIALGARLIPQRLHDAVIRILEPRREGADSFPPVYTMNSPAQLRAVFDEKHYEHSVYAYDGRPFYHLDRVAMARLWQVIYWLTPRPCKTYLSVFLHKRGPAPPRQPAWPVPPMHQPSAA
jgi:SAM-dependent methyltransferase